MPLDTTDEEVELPKNKYVQILKSEYPWYLHDEGDLGELVDRSSMPCWSVLEENKVRLPDSFRFAVVAPRHAWDDSCVHKDKTAFKNFAKKFYDRYTFVATSHDYFTS